MLLAPFCVGSSSHGAAAKAHCLLGAQDTLLHDTQGQRVTGPRDPMCGSPASSPLPLLACLTPHSAARALLVALGHPTHPLRRAQLPLPHLLSRDLVQSRLWGHSDSLSLLCVRVHVRVVQCTSVKVFRKLSLEKNKQPL